jgi:hypothetical protein
MDGMTDTKKIPGINCRESFCGFGSLAAGFSQKPCRSKFRYAFYGKFRLLLYAEYVKISYI